MTEEAPIGWLRNAASRGSTAEMRRDSLLLLTVWGSYILRYGEDPKSSSDLVHLGLPRHKVDIYQIAFERTYPGATPSAVVRESGLLEQMRSDADEAKDIRSGVRLLRRVWRKTFERPV